MPSKTSHSRLLRSKGLLTINIIMILAQVKTCLEDVTHRYFIGISMLKILLNDRSDCLLKGFFVQRQDYGLVHAVLLERNKAG